MIFGVEDESRPVSMQEYTPTFSEVNEAAFLNTWYDNPTVKGLAWWNTFKAEDFTPKMTQEEATRRANEAKVQIKNIPKEGLTERAFELLLDRQRRTKQRAEVLQTAEAGFFRQALPSLAAGFLDPINIGVDVALGFGLAKGFGFGAKALSSAGSAGSRALVRARLGAVEGTLAATAVEPLSYSLSQGLGDDYNAFDSLQNIAFGTVFGGGLHMGAGAIADALSKGLPPVDAVPQGKVASQIDDAPLHVKQEYAKTAANQMLNDAHVDVATARQLDIDDAHTTLDQIDAKIQAIRNSPEFKKGGYAKKARKLKRLEAQREKAINRLDEVQSDVESSVRLEGDTEKVLNKEYFEQEFRDRKTGKFNRAAARKHMAHQVKEALDNGDKVFYTKPDGSKRRILDVNDKNIVTNTGEAIPLKAIIQDNTKVAKVDKTGKPNDAMVSITPKKRAQTPRPINSEAEPQGPVRNSRLINEELEAKHNEELKLVEDHDKLEVVTDQADLSELELRELADATDTDIDGILESGNKQIAEAKEHNTLLKSLAKCLTMRG